MLLTAHCCTVLLTITCKWVNQRPRIQGTLRCIVCHRTYTFVSCILHLCYSFCFWRATGRTRVSVLRRVNHLYIEGIYWFLDCRRTHDDREELLCSSCALQQGIMKVKVHQSDFQKPMISFSIDLSIDEVLLDCESIIAISCRYPSSLISQIAPHFHESYVASTAAIHWTWSLYYWWGFT